jgi:hypothetical protein
VPRRDNRRDRDVAIALARRAADAAIPFTKALVRWARASHLPPRRKVASLAIPSPSADVESRVEGRLLTLVV